ncbi:hypothetical protein [Chryseobacterium echinoideorum]|uniref:hypothetical protein n=1 Tax=Chryseobacterium echinoideorum TaxID=1549648 RepID=UPI0011867E5D|nr:hypothetical protein [Chryseobacterium echinoideorum]
MKKIALLVICALFSNSLFSQQWDGAANSTDNIFRNGNVSIGANFANTRSKLVINGNTRLIDNSKILFGNDPVTRPTYSHSFYTIMYNYDPAYYVDFPPSTVVKRGLYMHPTYEETNGVYQTIPTDKIALYLSDSKKVGIGTDNVDCSNCLDYRLFVKDGIKTEKVKVEIAANSGWADYVFEKDYKLMPLRDLQSFIDEKGHLPEIPTTDEAIANGIELKEMNILLLKKIEELTLYTLQQQKNIEEQNKRIEGLEKKLSK